MNIPWFKGMQVMTLSIMMETVSKILLSPAGGLIYFLVVLGARYYLRPVCRYDISVKFQLVRTVVLHRSVQLFM
jgi:hypothetical protein